MTALALAAPPIRRRPVPIAEPRAALRVVRDEETAVPPMQGVLSLTVPSATPATARSGAPTTARGSAPGTAPGTAGTARNGTPATARGSSPATARGSSPATARGSSPATARGSSPGSARNSASGSAARADLSPTAVRCLRPTPKDGDQAAAEWAHQFVQAAMEVAAGLRPAGQLVRWTSADVHATLARRCTLAARRERAAALGRAVRQPARAVVRSVRVCDVRDGVAEACAVVSEPGRTRAVALRLEAFAGRWRVTALEIG